MSPSSSRSLSWSLPDSSASWPPSASSRASSASVTSTSCWLTTGPPTVLHVLHDWARRDGLFRGLVTGDARSCRRLSRGGPAAGSSPLARPLASRLPHRLLPNHLSGGHALLGLRHR